MLFRNTSRRFFTSIACGFAFIITQPFLFGNRIHDEASPLSAMLEVHQSASSWDRVVVDSVATLQYRDSFYPQWDYEGLTTVSRGFVYSGCYHSLSRTLRGPDAELRIRDAGALDFLDDFQTIISEDKSIDVSWSGPGEVTIAITPEGRDAMNRSSYVSEAVGGFVHGWVRLDNRTIVNVAEPVLQRLHDSDGSKNIQHDEGLYRVEFRMEGKHTGVPYRDFRVESTSVHDGVNFETVTEVEILSYAAEENAIAISAVLRDHRVGDNGRERLLTSIVNMRIVYPDAEAWPDDMLFKTNHIPAGTSVMFVDDSEEALSGISYIWSAEGPVPAVDKDALAAVESILLNPETVTPGQAAAERLPGAVVDQPQRDSLPTWTILTVMSVAGGLLIVTGLFLLIRPRLKAGR